MVDNKWYALVTALFGISSAFNAYRYVKNQQKKKRSNGGVRMKDLVYAIIMFIIACAFVILTVVHNKLFAILVIFYLYRTGVYAYRYYQYRKYSKRL